MEDGMMINTFNLPRNSFQVQMNEHDMLYIHDDQIEISDQTESKRGTQFAEETIPATPYFDTDPVNHIFDEGFEPEFHQINDNGVASEEDEITPKKKKNCSPPLSVRSLTPAQSDIMVGDAKESVNELLMESHNANSMVETPVLLDPTVKLCGKNADVTPGQTYAKILFSKTPEISASNEIPQPPALIQTPMLERVPKVRISYETPKKSQRSFMVPYSDGPMGTPKTGRWLLHEVNLRYQERHHTDSSPINQLLLEGEELCLRDVLKHVLEPDAKLIAK
jgi:hypothetical protein